MRMKVQWTLLFFGAALLVGCASAFVLHPDSGASAPAEHQLFVDSPDGRLEILVVRRGGAGRCEPSLFVLEFIGNSGAASASSLPRRIADSAPMEIWVVNYNGFGASEGRATLRSIPRAALSAYDAIAERAGSRPIVTYGFSLGSIPALHVAGERPVKAAIMRNVPCVSRLIMSRWGWWNLWLAAIPTVAQVPRSFSCQGNARRAKAPGFFLMSERDEVCPLRHQELTYRDYAGPKQVVLMKGARHNDAVPEAAQEELLRWLARTVGPLLSAAPRHDECPNKLFQRSLVGGEL